MDSLSPRAVRCLRNPRELPGATPQSAFCSVPRLPRLPSLLDLDREVQLVEHRRNRLERQPREDDPAHVLAEETALVDRAPQALRCAGRAPRLLVVQADLRGRK